MTEKDVSRDSKKLSWLLRHGAAEAGLSMDAAGWAEITDVLQALGLSREELVRAVRENTKSRLQLAEGRIRACQGHSREGMPVTLDALEESWTEWTGTKPVWHGTSAEALEAIAREGIRPIERTHVHLAAATDSAVGKRASVAVMLRVDPEALRAHGIKVYESPNGVLLVRRVPRECIMDLKAMTARARKSEGELRGHFGW